LDFEQQIGSWSLASSLLLLLCYYFYYDFYSVTERENEVAESIPMKPIRQRVTFHRFWYV
jgi:hypothetical protein